MMRLVTDENDNDRTHDGLAPEAAATAEWPAEVDMILSAMDMALKPGENRRASDRRAHRARADLRLYSHDPLSQPIALFTRDVSATGLGFITQERLPLGYNGLVRITLETGDVVTAACNVYRCRESISGWYEGAVHFTTRQPDLG